MRLDRHWEVGEVGSAEQCKYSLIYSDVGVLLVSGARAVFPPNNSLRAELTEEAMHVEGELLLRVGHSEALLGEAEHAGVVVVQDEHRGRARVRERGHALLVRRLPLVLVRVTGAQTIVVVVVLERFIILRNTRCSITRMETSLSVEY